MLLCFSKSTILPPEIVINGEQIGRVDFSKLLGIIASDDLKWQRHVDMIYSKASRKIYGLIMLAKAGVSQSDLLEVYTGRIRPLVEYACQLWHPGLTKEQSSCLESIQKRALRIIYKDTEYAQALELSKLPTLHDRRIEMCRKLFVQIQDKNHRLNKLLPPKKENTHGLRNINTYETVKCKTNRYKHSYIPYCLDNFQTK